MTVCIADMMSAINSKKLPVLFIGNFGVIEFMLNWLCMTRDYPFAHENTVLLAMDKLLYKGIQEQFPNLTIISLENVPLEFQRKFSSHDKTYHAFLRYRMDIVMQIMDCTNKTVLHAQPDIVMTPLLIPKLMQYVKDNENNIQIVSDILGNYGIMRRVVNGGFMLIASTSHTRIYIKNVRKDMEESQGTVCLDNFVMSIYCMSWSYGWDKACQYMDYSLIATQLWTVYDAFFFKMPQIQSLQLDLERKSSAKIEWLKTSGFYLLEEGGNGSLQCMDKQTPPLSTFDSYKLLTPTTIIYFVFFQILDLVQSLPIIGRSFIINILTYFPYVHPSLY